MTTSVAARLTRLLARNGVPMTGVSVGDETNKQTWRVDFLPEATPEQQAQAASLLDAYDPVAVDTVFENEQLDAEVLSEMDGKRLASAIVWAVIDTYSAPATRTKYLAARTKILNAYKTRPWLP